MKTGKIMFSKYEEEQISSLHTNKHYCLFEKKLFFSKKLVKGIKVKKNAKNFITVFVAVLVLLLIVYNGRETLPFAITGTGTGTIYVPKIGEVRCVEGSLSSNLYAIGLGTSKSGSFNPPLIIGEIINLDNQVNEAQHTIISYKCNGAYCETALGSTPSQHIVCPQGYSALWKVTKNGSPWFWNQLRYKEISFNYGQIVQENYNYSGDNKQFNENDTIVFEAICYGSAGFFYESRSPSQIKFYYSKREKQLRVFTDSQITLPATVGCSLQGINQATANGTYNPEDNSFSYIDPRTNQTTSLYVADLPNQLLLNQPAYQFVYKWEPISGINTIMTSSNKTYYVNQSNRSVYNVEEITTDGGTKYKIATSIAFSSPQCVNNQECSILKGSSGWQCDPDASFTCQQIQNYCLTSSDCGITHYVTIGTTTKKIVYSCISNQCQSNEVQVLCNPTASFPNNGCPQEKPACNLDGTFCFEPMSQKSPCPGDCCPPSEFYFEKLCPTNKYCQVGGGYVGYCVDPPVSCASAKNNGVCDNGEPGTLNCGETIETDPSDCKFEDSVAIACAQKNALADGIFVLGYDLVQGGSGGFLGFGATTYTQCLPIYNYPLIVIVLALIVSLVISFFILKSGRRKRRR